MTVDNSENELNREEEREIDGTGPTSEEEMLSMEKEEEERIRKSREKPGLFETLRSVFKKKKEGQDEETENLAVSLVERKLSEKNENPNDANDKNIVNEYIEKADKDPVKTIEELKRKIRRPDLIDGIHDALLEEIEDKKKQ